MTPLFAAAREMSFSRGESLAAASHSDNKGIRQRNNIVGSCDIPIRTGRRGRKSNYLLAPVEINRSQVSSEQFPQGKGTHFGSTEISFGLLTPLFSRLYISNSYNHDSSGRNLTSSVR